MRVPVRADGSALLLWVVAAVGAGGLTWWDAQDAAAPPAAAPRAPAADGDLVWMDAEDAAEVFGLGAVVADEGPPAAQDPTLGEERAEPHRP